MEGYFMKNIKSILKKLTLILLASFMFAGSQSLFAMDSDLQLDRPLLGSSQAGSDIADLREVESDTESEESEGEQEKRKIKFVLGQGDNVTEIPLPEAFDPNISGYISALVMFSKYDVKKETEKEQETETETGIKITINEESPENIRKVCDERIIRKLIGYLELVSENTSQLQLRSDLEDEIPEDFKALAILSDYFGVDSLMHACVPRCVEILTGSESLNKFKQDSAMELLFRDCFPGWRWLTFPKYLPYFVDGFDYKEVFERRLEGGYKSSVRDIKQSLDGRFVCVRLRNQLLKILRRDNDTEKYVDVATYENVSDYKISSDGKTVYIEGHFNHVTRHYLLKILRWNKDRFVESKIYEKVCSYKISSDDKTVCVEYCVVNGDIRTSSLKILRWNGNRLIELGTYENVCEYGISANGLMAFVKFNSLGGGVLKILRFDGSGFVETELYENVAYPYFEMSGDGQTVAVRFYQGRCYYKILRWNEKENKFVEHPEIYEGTCSCEISSDGKTVCVGYDEKSRSHSLKILKWNEKENKFNELGTYYNVSVTDVSKDGKTVCVGYNYDSHTLTNSLKILRWNGEQFVESISYDNVCFSYCSMCKHIAKMSADGKTVCVWFRYSLKILRWNGAEFVEFGLPEDRGVSISEDGKTVCFECDRDRCYPYSKSLKILRWNEERNQFAEAETYKNVSGYNISEDGNMIFVCFVDGTFKILSKYSEVKNIYQAMFVLLSQKEQAIGGLDLTKPDDGRQNTTVLLEILKSMPQEKQLGLIRDWNVKVSSEIGGGSNLRKRRRTR